MTCRMMNLVEMNAPGDRLRRREFQGKHIVWGYYFLWADSWGEDTETVPRWTATARILWKVAINRAGQRCPSICGQRRGP